MRNIVLGMALFSLLMLAADRTSHGGQAGYTLDDIKRAWQERQDGIKSLRVSWSEVRILPKGYIDLAMPGKKANEPRPPTDIRLPGQGVLLFDDHNCRFELKRSQWSAVEKKVKESEETNVYKDGKDTALTSISPVENHPSATLGPRKKPSDIMEYTYWPITCFARPLNPTFAPLNLDDFEITGRSPVVNGKRCVELTHKTRANNTTQFLLLDPQRGFLLLRYYIVTQDVVTLRLDVEYATHPVHGWVPKSWDYAASAGAIRLESKQVKQEMWELNPELGPDAFDVHLPPGTAVYDTTGGAAVQYAIRDDSKAGAAIPDSKAPSYDQLTEAAREGQKDRWWSSSVTVVIAGIVFALVALVLVWRVRRSRIDLASDQPPVS